MVSVLKMYILSTRLLKSEPPIIFYWAKIYKMQNFNIRNFEALETSPKKEK